MSIYEKIQALTRQLYPTGRAFKMPFNGAMDRLNNALVVSEEKFYIDAVGILDSILPDNNNFTSQDATDWEVRLGLITNLAVSLSNRKAAISRKLNAPGINPAKGHYLNLESQLQLAGFNVFIYENLAGLPPSSFPAVQPAIVSVQYGSQQYGSAQYGSNFTNKIANYIDEIKDFSFNLGNTYKRTFFIGGDISNAYIADVPLARKNEFRQLILKLKRMNTVGFIFVNYTP